MNYVPKQSFEQWQKEEKKQDKDKLFLLYQCWIWQIKTTLDLHIYNLKKLEKLKKIDNTKTIKELEDIRTILFYEVPNFHSNIPK